MKVFYLVKAIKISLLAKLCRCINKDALNIFRLAFCLSAMFQERSNDRWCGLQKRVQLSFWYKLSNDVALLCLLHSKIITQQLPQQHSQQLSQ